MRHRRDPIAVLEAAYAWEPDEDRWLGSVLDALASFDLGGGRFTYLADLEGRSPRMRAVAARGVTVDPAWLRRAFPKVPADLSVPMHAPSSLVESVSASMARLSRRLGHTLAGIEAAIELKLPPAWGMRPGDPGRFCWATVFVAPNAARPTPQAARQLRMIAPHLASAARLRLALSAPPHAEDPSTEAVLRPDGKIDDARGEARPYEARASLSELARRIDLARTRQGRAAALDALGAWNALLDGRWTLVESRERDGRRVLLARKNPPELRDPIALGPKERAVVALAVEGQPIKAIVYALGMSRDAVTAHLRSSLRKLHVRSRAELIRVYAPLLAGLPRPG